MSAPDIINSFMRRNRPEEIIPPMSFNEETHIFQMDGGALGAVYFSPLMAGGDDVTAMRLETALNTPLPKGAFIQASLLSTRDIEPILNQYISSRHRYNREGLSDEQSATLLALTDKRIQMYRDGVDGTLIKGAGVRSNYPYLLVTVSVPPLKNAPDYTQKQVDEVSETFQKVAESMRSAGLEMSPLNAQEYVTYMRRLHQPFKPLQRWYDESRYIRDQILTPEDDTEILKEGGFRINDTFFNVLSIQHMPKEMSLLRMARIAGDPRGIDNQISIPYVINCSIHYPEQTSARSMVMQKSTTINYMAYGKLSKWVPKIGHKKEGIDVLVESMESSRTLCQISLSVTLASRDRKELARQTAALKAYYHSLNIMMAEEKDIGYEVFWNTLPLYPSSESIKNLFRHHTMSTVHAVQFLPVIGDWPGTGEGAAMLMASRRGQPVPVDLYDSPTGYSAIVAGQTGSGKSVFVQRMISDYLAMGAKVWAIDTGRSYFKECRMIDGEFIEFSETSKTCLNPFTLVTDIKEEMEFLVSLVAKMASPNQGLPDIMLAMLQEAIDNVWGNLGNNMTITNLADYLGRQEDPRLKDIATQLYPYTRNGNHGEWFEGENNLHFDNNFVVLELDDLKSKPSLQKVVMMQLITRIQQEMYLQRDGRPKIVIIEEAADLLSEESASTGGDDMVARFIEAGYRRARKANGAYVSVVQAISDIYNNPVGHAIADNSPNKFILSHTQESIERARTQKYLDLDDAGFEVLKTVHTRPGAYSEVFVYTPGGWGVARHIEDRFALVLFSSKGKERDLVINAIERGVPVTKAVEDFIENHG